MDSDRLQHDIDQSFFDSVPDLSGTRYGPADLEGARSVYRDLFVEVDPMWPESPTGPLAMRWRSQGTQSACYLIYIADLFAGLSRNITTKSTPILRDKARQLLRPASDAAYDEVVAELEVARIISHAISPISFEPMVPDGLSGSPKQPMSPDLGLRLPDGDVAIEVTVWHWQALRDWESAREQLYARLSARLQKAELARQVQVAFPLNVTVTDIDSLVSAEVIRAMARPTGEKTVRTGRGDATLKWAELPKFPSFESIGDGTTTTAFGMGVVGSVAHAFGMSSHPVFGPSTIEDALKSLTKSLGRKRRQAIDGVPNVIALGLGSYRLSWDWLGPLIARRVWPNNKYRWISAIAALTSEQAWDQPEGTARLTMEWNPNAAMPAPQSLRNVAAGGATYHS